MGIRYNKGKSRKEKMNEWGKYKSQKGRQRESILEDKEQERREVKIDNKKIRETERKNKSDKRKTDGK